jgi:hypothetical protein
MLPDHALPKPVTLFKAEGPEVYLVEEKTWTHRHIVDWETFLHLGFEQSDIVTNTRFAGYPEGPPITRLLKGAGERVYWMENSQRRHIPDMETFLHLGHRQEDISRIPDELLVSWPLGEPLPSVLDTPTEPVPPLSQEMVVPTYSPRDRWGGGNHFWEIYTVFTDGTRPKRLSHTTSYMVYFGPVWSPDGRYIAFSSRPYANGGPTVIAVTSFDSWNPTQLTGNVTGYHYTPVWSSDGARIAFSSSVGVYVMDADGGNLHWLANGRETAWTPDGRIAFCARVYEGSESIWTLTVMDADGQNQQPIRHSITVLDQHYYPWRQEVWVAGGDPCSPAGS